MVDTVRDPEDKIKEHCEEVARTVWKWEGNIEVSMKPLGAGKNFLSDAYFATIKNFDLRNGEESRKVFVKVPPAVDPTKKYIFNTISATMKPFEREYVLYAVLADKFDDLCRENNEEAAELKDYISESFLLPGKLSLERSLSEPLLLEDLGAAGFKMWEDEFNGLDLQHALKVMETLGKHHAFGMVFVEKTKSFEDEIYEDLLLPEFSAIFTDPMVQMMEGALKYFVDWMEANKYDSDSKDKVENMQKGLKELFRSVYEEMQMLEPQSFTHGDCRLNNFMFKYASDGQTPIRVKVVDFQGWYKGPPIIELSYFLMSSVSPDILIKNFETIFAAYYSSLAGVLARLNYPKQRPSLQTFKNLFMETAYFGFISTCNMLNIVFMGNPALEAQVKDERMRNLLRVAKFFDII